jgi:excisionase family DNA binding protein
MRWSEMVGDEALARQKPLGVPEVAKELSYSEKSIREMLNRGDIKGTRLRPGGKWLITREDLDNYKADRGLEPARVQTESDTRIESQLLEQDPTAAEARRKHDKRIFQDSDAIMSERDILAFLYSLSVGRSRTSSRSLQVAKFLTHFNYESNRYLSGELYDLTETLCDALEAISKFTADSFYDTDRTSDGTLFRLYPYFEIVERNQQDEDKWRRQYNIYADELDRLIDTARKACKAYRIAVRETLFL